MEAVFNKGLCGWREVTHEKVRDTPFGTDSEFKREYVVNPSTRMCNEDCANHIRYMVEGAIGHLTQFGKLDENKIYDEWNGLYYNLLWSLVENFWLNGNTFMITDYHKISTITTFAISFNTITYKALDGFTMEEIAESILTQTIIKSGHEIDSKKSKNPLDFIFGGKKKVG